MMFIRTSEERIISTEQIVEVDISPARERKEMASYEEAAEHDFPEGNVIHARELTVGITTTAVSSDVAGGPAAHTIRLYNEEAELFLAALAKLVYEPTVEEAR